MIRTHAALVAAAVAAVAAVAALAGCYAPKIQDQQFSCAGGTSCPSGFTCLCGSCRPNDTTGCSDGGAPADLAGASHDMSGGGGVGPCSNGQRAPGDPGVTGVAFCPAAWTVPGLTSAGGRATPCNRKPTANGMSASGTACSAEDNCAAGWHVCNGDADLQGKGFTAAQCSAAPSGLWVTLQSAGIPMSGGMPSGPPSCAVTPEHAVAGCGSGGMPVQGCQIVQKQIVDTPSTSVDECSSFTGGAFTCPGVGMSMPEVVVVVKSMLAGGGVMCCAN